jgi:hypothetical protein
MIARVTEYRIVPVAVVAVAEDALPLADALMARPDCLWLR